MSKNELKKLIKSRILKNALEYLNIKRGSKGKEIEYNTIEMAEYLMPYNWKLHIEEKRKMFEIRNRMTRIVQLGTKLITTLGPHTTTIHHPKLLGHFQAC